MHRLLIAALLSVAAMSAARADIMILKGAVICRSLAAIRQIQTAIPPRRDDIVKSGLCYLARGHAMTVAAEVRDDDIVTFRTKDLPRLTKYTLYDFITYMNDGE